MTVEHCSQLKTLPGCSNNSKAQQNIILWLQRHFVNRYRHCERWRFGRESTEEATKKIILTAHSLYGTSAILPAFLNHCSIITNQNCNSSENADIEGLHYSYYCICKYVSCLLRSPFCENTEQLWLFERIKMLSRARKKWREFQLNWIFLSLSVVFITEMTKHYH